MPSRSLILFIHIPMDHPLLAFCSFLSTLSPSIAYFQDLLISTNLLQRENQALIPLDAGTTLFLQTLIYADLIFTKTLFRKWISGLLSNLDQLSPKLVVLLDLANTFKQNQQQFQKDSNIWFINHLRRIFWRSHHTLWTFFIEQEPSNPRYWTPTNFKAVLNNSYKKT